MKYDSNNNLIIDRDKDTIKGIFEMFGVLEDMEWDEAMVFSIEKFEIEYIKKDPIDIFKLDFPHSNFYGEVFLWLNGSLGRKKTPTWQLDKEHTDLFLKCLTTSAKYYLFHKTKFYLYNPKNYLVDLFHDVFKKEMEGIRYYQN